jgi:hypothetical protein
MNIIVNKLKQSENAFYRIVPRKVVGPLGTIALNIIFGGKSHFRKVQLDFEVVD